MYYETRHLFAKMIKIGNMAENMGTEGGQSVNEWQKEVWSDVSGELALGKMSEMGVDKIYDYTQTAGFENDVFSALKKAKLFFRKGEELSFRELATQEMIRSIDTSYQNEILELVGADNTPEENIRIHNRLDRLVVVSEARIKAAVAYVEAKNKAEALAFLSAVERDNAIREIIKDEKAQGLDWYGESRLLKLLSETKDTDSQTLDDELALIISSDWPVKMLTDAEDIRFRDAALVLRSAIDGNRGRGIDGALEQSILEKTGLTVREIVDRVVQLRQPKKKSALLDAAVPAWLDKDTYANE